MKNKIKNNTFDRAGFGAPHEAIATGGSTRACSERGIGAPNILVFLFSMAVNLVLWLFVLGFVGFFFLSKILFFLSPFLFDAFSI
jgi:hypothetical protein